MKKIELYIDIYHVYFSFNVIGSMKNKNIPKEFQKGYGAITKIGLNKSELLSVDVFCSKNDINYGLVVHELQHATNYILKHIGIKPCFDNDEAQAYLIGYLSKLVFTFIHENKIQING